LGLGLPRAIAACAAVGLLAGWSGVPPPATSPAREAVPSSLASTPGAASYLDDRVCATCHSEIAGSFQDVAMSQAFLRPAAARPIEDFGALPFYHASSNLYLELRRQGESLSSGQNQQRLLFRSFRRAPGDTVEHNLLETPVAWVLGSGNHARTYLARAGNGELFLLPIAWYGQTRRWGMAPGYDRPDHAGPTRLVRRECFFCHGADPGLSKDGDSRLAATHAMPAELPQGIGCQRCHGPGSGHVALAAGGIGTSQEIRGAIVNPGRLSRERQRDVCYQCHYQPSVAMSGLRRLGQGDFSFRPGDAIADHLVALDVEQEGGVPGDRFEINHHPYRLEQSRCFTASSGALGCLSCHDPHRKVAATERAAHYRAACLSCHQPASCTGSQRPAVEDRDCASCHMPVRRPTDVVQVLMTDHKIQRGPGNPELTAARAESDPVVLDVRLLEPGSVGDLAAMYRALAAVRTQARTPAALDALARQLHQHKPQQAEPYLDLVDGLLAVGRARDASPVVAALAARWPLLRPVRERQALLALAKGETAPAQAGLEALLADGWRRPELLYNLGLAREARGDLAGARDAFLQAVTDRDFMTPAWVRLARLEARLGDEAAAAEAYRRALAIAPEMTAIQAELDSLLSKKLEIKTGLR
jgi:hypothetical protein